MIQEIELNGEKRLAMVFDNKETLEEVELYRCSLLDLACYAAAMAEENPNIDFTGHGVSHAIKIARMMEKR